MEQNETSEQFVDQPVKVINKPAVAASSRSDGLMRAVSPHTDGGSCPTCGVGTTTMSASYIYALGRIEARFPRMLVEKEFAQVTGRADTIGLTDRQALHKIVTVRQDRYLVRQLSWVITVEDTITYILLA